MKWFFQLLMELFWIAVLLVLVFGAIWLEASLITSGIKALSGSCNQTYVVEKVLAGNWFCPSEGK